MRYHLFESESQNLQVHSGLWPSASLNIDNKKDSSTGNFIVQTLLLRSQPFKIITIRKLGQQCGVVWIVLLVKPLPVP